MNVRVVDSGTKCSGEPDNNTFECNRCGDWQAVISECQHKNTVCHVCKRLFVDSTLTLL